MCSPEPDDAAKIKAYFEIIDEHTVAPINNTDLSKSCVATIMLLFAAMDGLGKLIHPRDTARVRARFQAFLLRMGKDYAEHADALWELRNSLMHNALNTVSFMSNTWMGERHHLKRESPEGLIFVSTTVLLKDFCAAKDQLQEELRQNPELARRAGERLEWLEDDPQEYWSVPTTPPGPVRFVVARRAETSA